jgi:hypothetical protein
MEDLKLHLPKLIQSAVEARNECSAAVAGLEPDRASGYAATSAANSLIAIAIVQAERLKRSDRADARMDAVVELLNRALAPRAPEGIAVESDGRVTELIAAVGEGLDELESASLDRNPRAQRIVEAYKACMRPL